MSEEDFRTAVIVLLTMILVNMILWGWIIRTETHKIHRAVESQVVVYER